MRLQRMDWLIIALVVFALGGVLAYEYWPESPRYAVVEADRELQGLKAGTTVPLTYAVRNLGSDPMRVVGATYSWGQNCCFGSKLSRPETIPPGGTWAMPFEVTPSEAGAFACEIEIYLDVGYLATHPIKVHGTATK